MFLENTWNISSITYQNICTSVTQTDKLWNWEARDKRVVCSFITTLSVFAFKCNRCIHTLHSDVMTLPSLLGSLISLCKNKTTAKATVYFFFFFTITWRVLWEKTRSFPINWCWHPFLNILDHKTDYTIMWHVLMLVLVFTVQTFVKNVCSG